jgi:hypothetical protein
MARKKNPYAKMRPISDPYEIWENVQAGWQWRVLKKYQHPDNETPTSRWLCAVRSPYTHGSWEMGDVYAGEVLENAQPPFPVNPEEAEIKYREI